MLPDGTRTSSKICTGLECATRPCSTSWVQVRQCYAAGDWEQGRLRDAAAPGEDAEDSDADVFGDFEDVETGQSYGADGDAATATALKAIEDEARARREEKAAQKAAFDSEYDVGVFLQHSNDSSQRPSHGPENDAYPQHRDSLPFSTAHTLPKLRHSRVMTLSSLILVALGTGGSAGVKDKPQRSQPGSAEAEEEETYYDAMKKEMAVRAERTKAALGALDPRQRIAMEGFRPGAYLRLRFTGGYASLIFLDQRCDACACPLHLRNVGCGHDTGACPNPKPRLLPRSDQARLYHRSSAQVLTTCTQADFRLHCAGLPCELVQNFTPMQPLLVGGLSTTEEGRGYLQLRLKRHRWFPKILKTRDPLTFSIGWRRFQSVPVYAIEDQNGRQRYCLVN